MINLELLETLGKLAAEERERRRDIKERQAIVNEHRNDWATFSAGSGSVGVPAPQAVSVGIARDFTGIDRLYETSQEREKREGKKA